jgi:hypothetical protein
MGIECNLPLVWRVLSVLVLLRALPVMHLDQACLETPGSNRKTHHHTHPNIPMSKQLVSQIQHTLVHKVQIEPINITIITIFSP